MPDMDLLEDREPDPLSVLIVDDDRAVRELQIEYLQDAELLPGRPAAVRGISSLQQAHAALRSEDVDLVILDLGLPDSDGLDTVLDMVEAHPPLPFVVVTGSAEIDIDVRALAAGAQDVLYKDELSRSSYVRLLRRVMARHASWMRTIDVLASQRLRAASSDNVAAFLEGSEPVRPRPLREVFPRRLDDLGERYGVLVRQRLEERTVDLDHRTSARLHDWAGDMARLRATPKDLADLHVEVMLALTEEEPRARARALLDVGSLLLTQALGQLAAHYRALALSERWVKADDTPAPADGGGTEKAHGDERPDPEAQDRQRGS